MPIWLSHALEWLGAGGVGLSFLGTLWAYVLVKGKLIVAAKTKQLTAAYEASKVSEEPITRRLPSLPEGEADTPDAQLLFFRDRCAHLLERLSQERFAYSEAAKLSDARERALENELKATRDELKLARSDLAVATSARIVAERAGLAIEKQWRAAQGLDSDAPPAHPRSSSAVTKPPPKPR